ncbi:berberine bridge enzyme-like 14 isoform X2 [Herrania umbratica]|uniref:Berberine bridge enzyme-like 14 isoform X2 n=1 Tax=Herrania umbratica TaxID=108875 RepID=A0A6J1BFD5_9ROSI|nr:berberine bridge enzyme-like 14 isoform X2 [Herrania umbratica]
MRNPVSILSVVVFLLCNSMANSDVLEESSILQCLSNHSVTSPPISSVTYFPTNPSYTSILQSYIRNLRFTSDTTPKPLFIVVPSHVSHIQASIICCKIHGWEMRIRSGGHDYDGLSYVSAAPFMILDTFNLRFISVDMEDESAWVQSGATLGELFYRIAEKSKTHGFPAGVCPTVGVGGHFSGGGYGNMMRKHGLSTDNIVDAQLVDANGRILDRESMGEDLFWAIRGGGGASFGVILSWKINEMSWIESVLFWSNYPKGTSLEVLLNRQPQPEKYLKKKSDYVQEPISKKDLEGIWKKMIELRRPALTLNPYGGKMSEISESETPFPHRVGNIYKIQYSVTWKEDGPEAADRSLDQIARIYDYMTPYVSKSPRSSYLNYRDVDIGINEIGNASYSEAKVWASKYFKGNFDRLVQVKSMVDPGNFFRYEQSIPSLTFWKSTMAE